MLRHAPRAHHAHTALAGSHAPLDAADAQEGRQGGPLLAQYPPMPGHHWQEWSALQSAKSAAEGQDVMQLTLVDAQYPAPHHRHDGCASQSVGLLPSEHELRQVTVAALQ